MMPDKIYVREYQDGYYSPSWWDEKPHEEESIGMKAVCYIRKDAVLEWLHFKKCNSVDKYVRQTYEEVIDKLNSI